MRSLRLRLLRLRLLRLPSRLLSSVFSALALEVDNPNQFLIRVSNDTDVPDVSFSVEIGAGAAGVIPFTAATGLTAFATSSAFWM